MKNLISMTDFVLEQRKKESTDNIRRFWACEKYAKFLKQQLELWMFDKDDGRCLFDEITGYKICNNGGFYIYYNKKSMVFVNEKDTIESIVDCNIQLTPTAIKQIAP